MSRTTHELQKAKVRVVVAAVALQTDPTNREKYASLEKALDDLERDRDTVQGALVKAFAHPNRQVAVPGQAIRSDFAKTLNAGEHGVDRKRLNYEYPTGQKDIFRGSS